MSRGEKYSQGQRKEVSGEGRVQGPGDGGEKKLCLVVTELLAHSISCL